MRATAEPDITCVVFPDGAKSQPSNKNGKKADSSGSSFFTWFIVLALLGVWTSVAVVYFDLVDYQGVLGGYPPPPHTHTHTPRGTSWEGVAVTSLAFVVICPQTTPKVNLHLQ